MGWFARGSHAIFRLAWEGCAGHSWRVVRVLTVLILSSGTAFPAVPDFVKEVRPVLERRCFNCHGAKEQKGKVRLDTLSTDLVKDARSAEMWQEVRAVINLGEMPPKEEGALAEAERRMLLDWLNPTIAHAAKMAQSKGGRVVMRRLNRREYQNTMRDLLGVELDYTRDFPPDGVSTDGMLNNGSALQMNAIQLEYYLAAARKALDKMITTEPAPKVFKHRFEKSTDGKFPQGISGSNEPGRKSEFIVRMRNDYPEQGQFRIRLKVHVEIPMANGPVPQLHVRVGYRPDTLVDMGTLVRRDLNKAGAHELEFMGRIENFPLPVRGQGKYPGLVVMVANEYDRHGTFGQTKEKEVKDEKGRKRKVPNEGAEYPKLRVEWLEFEGPIFEQWPPAEHRRILFDSDQRESDEAGYARAVMARFLPRAWRRPVEATEVARFTEFFKKLRPNFPTFEDAMREVLVMALVSPDFLYLMEPASEKKRPLNAHELASRLSYFLWSSMPDETLRRLADTGELLKPKVLAAQVDRMVADPKSGEFTEAFVTQWLDADAMHRVEIDAEVYKGYGPSPRNTLLWEAIRREPVAFFAEILQRDLSARNFIRSEFVMLNDLLAWHYQFPAVHGGTIRPVPVPAKPENPQTRRGGLSTQAAFLMGASTGSDSHPIKRAVFVRERLLDDPPAPPPPNVPDLETVDPKIAELSIREQLKLHSNDAACADCHRGIDGWGLAMEEYDALGRWRDRITRRLPNRKTIQLELDAVATMPDGREVEGMEALKDYLLAVREDQIARAMVVKLLTYGLGRTLEFSDEPHVDALTKQFKRDNLRMRALVKTIVTSEVFRTK